MTRWTTIVVAAALSGSAVACGQSEPAAAPAHTEVEVAEPHEPEAEGHEPGPAEVTRGGANPLGLPADLQAALRREMVLLEQGMKDLQGQIARGQGEEAAATAQRIHDSFILSQELTDAQMETLVEHLPPEFLHRDRAFHAEARRLAEAAREGDFAVAAQAYGSMTTQCVGCHAAHAAARFPALEGESIPPPELPDGAGDEHAHGHAHEAEPAAEPAAHHH